MTLQSSPPPSRAKGRVSATLERRMQRQKAGQPDQHGIDATNKTMRPSRRERRDRRAKQPKEEERPVSGWVRPPDSTD